MSHPYFGTSGPMILGHRGAAGCAPENTLLAFERCLALGAHAIESDVQITADGIPVLFHDAEVGRVTEGTGRVHSHSLAELCLLDAGHHFSIEERGTTEPEISTAFRGQGVRVPSLHQAFEAFPAARFNLEIKTTAHDAVGKVVELVAQLGREDRTLLTAGDDDIMQVLRTELQRRKLPSATGASLAEIVAVVRSAVEGSAPPAEIQAIQIPADFGGRALVTEDLLAHTKRHGIAVHVWTINDVDEMARLLDMGVDGIVTDFPGRLAELLARRSPAS